MVDALHDAETVRWTVWFKMQTGRDAPPVYRSRTAADSRRKLSRRKSYIFAARGMAYMVYVPIT
jgi:hypothetical protein